MAGREWVVEALGCDPAALASLPALEALFTTLIEDLSLHPVATPTWHCFPPPGLNLFCCRPRAEWDFAGHLKRAFGATTVWVRRLERPYLRHRAPARGA